MGIDESKRLTRAELAAFSLPMLVPVAIELAWRAYLPAYFSTTLGLSLTAAGAILMAARLLDVVIDPAIAWASDRFPTRYGYRRPWLVASVAPILLGTAGVFFAWPWTDAPTLVAACLLLHLGYMMLLTPHGGWALELGSTPAERMRIMAAKTWFATAGTMLLLALLTLVERGFAGGLAGQTAALGWMLLVLTPCAVFLVLRFVREPAHPSCRPVDRQSPLRLFRDILATRALWPILALYLLTGCAEAASGAVFLWFVEHGLSLSGWGSALLLVQAGVTLVMLPWWSRVGARIGQHRLLALAYGWQAAVAPLAFMLPAGSLAAAIAFLLVRSLFGGVEFMVLRAMVAGVAQEAAGRGQRQGASFYSVSNITLKVAMGGGAWLALAALASSGIHHLDTNIPFSPGQVLAVRAAYAVPMAMAGTAGLLILIWFRSRSRDPAITGADRRRGLIRTFVAPGDERAGTLYPKSGCMRTLTRRDGNRGAIAE